MEAQRDDSDERREVAQLSWRRSAKHDDPLPETTRRSLDGRELRQSIVAILQMVKEPLSIVEIQRLLAWQGVEPTRDPKRAIANALRNELPSGRITKVSRGTYSWSRGETA